MGWFLCVLCVREDGGLCWFCKARSHHPGQEVGSAPRLARRALGLMQSSGTRRKAGRKPLRTARGAGCRCTMAIPPPCPAALVLGAWSHWSRQEQQMCLPSEQLPQVLDKAMGIRIVFSIYWLQMVLLYFRGFPPPVLACLRGLL